MSLIPTKTGAACRAVLIGVVLVVIAWATAAPAAAAAEKPEKQTDRIRVYRGNSTTRSWFHPDVQDSWKDISPTKYDVWYQPYKDVSLKEHHAFIIHSDVNDPTLPYPAAGRRGMRVVFCPCDGAAHVYIYVKDPTGFYRTTWGRQGSCHEVYQVAQVPHKQPDGTIKPQKVWLSGTYDKEFKYKLTKADDGRDKLIVHHVTGNIRAAGRRYDPDVRHTVIWEIVLGDWFATIRAKESKLQGVALHPHFRMIAVPGKGQAGKDIVLDAKIDGEKGYYKPPNDPADFPVDFATQRRYAFVFRHGQQWWYNPDRGGAALPFIWWEKQGSGRGWAYNGGGRNGRYQSVGRHDATSAGLIRVGGLPMLQMDLLRNDTKLSKTLQPGRYRRLARAGRQWKFDRIIEVTEKNIGKDVPAKVEGDEYLYLVDDLEERIFSNKAKQ